MKTTQMDSASHQKSGERASHSAPDTMAAGIADPIPQIAPNSRHLSPRDVTTLQRTVGNQAVLRLLGRAAAPPRVIQRKLTVGPVDDGFEQEVERAAAHVTAAPRRAAVQRRDEPAPVGPEGGPVAPDLAARIQRAKQGGRPLPHPVRRKAEQSLGADFGPVRVHEGAESHAINRALGAKAATTGNHIFLGQHQSPHDTGLMAHELTHTIQQGAIPRTDVRRRAVTPDDSAADLQMSPDGRAGLIQRTPAVVRAPVTSRVWLGALDNLAPKDQIKTVSRGGKGRQYNKLQTVDLEDANDRHVKDADGNIVWYRIKNASAFVPASKVLAGVNPTGGKSKEPDLGGDDVVSLVGAAGSLPSSIDNDLVEAQQWYFKKDERGGLTNSESTESTKLNKAEATMWTAGSAIGVASGIMGMAAALKDLADNEKGAWDKVDAVFDYLASTMDTVGSLSGTMGGISAFVNLGAEEGSKTADTSADVSGWGFGYQAMFGALSGGIKTIKSVADLVHMIYEEKKGTAVHDRDDYLSTISNLLTGALDTARSVLVSIRQITQLVQGGIMDVFDNIIPGLDIAVAAVNMIFEGYYLIESAVHHWWMKSRKKELMAKLQQQGYEKDQVKEAQKFYAQGEAKKANFGNQMGKNKKSYDKTDKKLTKTTDQDKLDELSSKKGDLVGKNLGIGRSSRETEQQMQAYESRGNPSRGELSELSLVSELKDANRKRIVRQSIHIGSNLMKIAGSITALVAGPGAPAGIGLKAAAAGIDVSLPFARSFKQWGRNKAAKKLAKGETGKSSKFFSKIFNANKSTSAKLTHRKKQAVKILLLVAGLNHHLPLGNSMTKKKALAADIRQVERYIRSAGCSPDRLYKANGNPAEQIKILVEALSKRELG